MTSMKTDVVPRAVLVLALIGAMTANSGASSQDSYRRNIAKFRAEQEAELKGPNGWLSVAGLFWLKRGENRFGADPSNEIVLTDGSVPPLAGVFEFHNGLTVIQVNTGANITMNGKPVTRSEVRSDAKQLPDVVRLGSLSLTVIKRGDRYGVRVRDLSGKRQSEFKGLRWFPVNEAYCITAKFVAYEQPRDIEIANVLGDVSKNPSPGYAVFSLRGREYRLEPILEGKDKLFFIFADLTNNKTTYGAGRFLYAGLPKDGAVTLDFNRAINPPCAFTTFATCPLPPRQNRLKVAITAGELNYSSAHQASPDR
ncbi:MAG TPA: DUF1684 domain-containing protein [Blastocatellia bacterium]|nr:DUF1684 domain-containing protein [Blastocatellia bacterium]